MKMELAALAVTVFAASSAFAAAEFKSLDQDGDSNISRSEAQADKDLVEKFSQYDSDSDKVISQKEFSAYQQAEKAQMGGSGGGGGGGSSSQGGSSSGGSSGGSGSSSGGGYQ